MVALDKVSFSVSQSSVISHAVDVVVPEGVTVRVTIIGTL